MKAIKIIILSLTIINFFAACNNKDFLSAPTDSSQLTINTVENAQALLDNTGALRETPGLGELSADDFYLIDATATHSIVELNAYLWAGDLFQGQTLQGDWVSPYRQIYFANSILEAIPKFAGSGTQEEIDHIKGSAQFIRAYALFGIALEFANLYGPKAGTDLGVPIRLSSNPEIQSNRATVQVTYDQILTDLKQALPLLPKAIDNSKKNRPSLPAGYALLARVYLSMADYTQARLYADSCLQIHSALMDYNGITINSTLPFSANNEEVIYSSNLLSTIRLLYQDNLLIDTNLYQSYGPFDLRKDVYFGNNNQGHAILKPGYSGTVFRFSGLATDEALLIRAESNARLNNTNDALDDLNTLLKKRWKDGRFAPLTASSSTEALNLILTERRKSLVSRGLRWIDLRRFNRENRGISLKRLMNGKEYTLPAGDNRFVLPIPPDVISSVQGMSQNPR
jgi:hypothetical protein